VDVGTRRGSAVALPYHRSVARRRVLLVDDEPGVRRVLRSYLEAEGFEVAEADTGETAVEHVRLLAPDLVVLDVMLPGIDGIEALRQLRTFSSVYVMLVTAKADEVDKLVGLSVGADDYVTKPFSPREVVARVKAVLRRQRDTGVDDDVVEGRGVRLRRRAGGRRAHPQPAQGPRRQRR